MASCVMLFPEQRVCGPGGAQCIEGNGSSYSGNEIGNNGGSSYSGSNNGEYCECVAGWSNIGDFATSPSGPCDMELTAVRVLWAILAVVQLWALIYASWFVKRKLSEVGFTIWDFRRFDGTTFTAIFVCSEGFFLLITGVLRAYDPKYFIVGGEIAISLFFSLGVGSFWVGGVLYCSSLIRVAFKNLRIRDKDTQAQTTKTLESMQRIIPLVSFATLSFTFLPFILSIINTSLAGTERVGEYDQIFAGAHFVGLGLVELILGLYLIPLWLESLIGDCEMVLKMRSEMNHKGGASSPTEKWNERLKTTTAKLRTFRTELRKQAIQQSILSILFGCWGYLTHKSSYILPITSISAGLVAILATWSFTNFKSQVESKGGPEMGSSNGDGTGQSSIAKQLKNSKTQVLGIQREADSVAEESYDASLSHSSINIKKQSESARRKISNLKSGQGRLSFGLFYYHSPENDISPDD